MVSSLLLKQVRPHPASGPLHLLFPVLRSASWPSHQPGPCSDIATARWASPEHLIEFSLVSPTWDLLPHLGSPSPVLAEAKSLYVAVLIHSHEIQMLGKHTHTPFFFFTHLAANLTQIDVRLFSLFTSRLCICMPLAGEILMCFIRALS